MATVRRSVSTGITALSLGSINEAQLDAPPSSIGLRFIRSGSLPASRAIHAAPVSSGGVEMRDRTIELNGPSTRGRDAHNPAPLPAMLRLVSSNEQRPAADAAPAAVLAVSVIVPPANRHAVIAFAHAPELDRVAAGAGWSQTPVTSWC